MKVEIRSFRAEDTPEAIAVWNEVVEDGVAFPQTEPLTEETGKACGFRILQFNAVVASNAPALQLYRKIGFTPLGTIPGGFRLKDGTYEDIVPHYISLV